MRHLYLVLDMSDAMKDQDLRPNRLFCSIEVRLIHSLSHLIDSFRSILAFKRIHLSLF